MKLLSIITIVYNDIDGIKLTENKLLNLPYWCEWIVVDGNSTDGTKEYVLNCLPKSIETISESDNGISDAFNKGINKAIGKYVIFINAGDEITEDFFRIVYPYVSSSIDYNVVVGKIQFGTKIVGKKISKKMQIYRNFLPHQAMLIKRSLFEDYGGYDIDFKLGMDYEWSLRLLSDWENNINFVPDVLCIMDTNGRSITNYKETFISYHNARVKNDSCNGFFSKSISYYYILKRMIGDLVRNVYAN